MEKEVKSFRLGDGGSQDICVCACLLFWQQVEELFFAVEPRQLLADITMLPLCLNGFNLKNFTSSCALSRQGKKKKESGKGNRFVSTL